MGKEIDLLLLLKKLHDDKPAKSSSSVLISKLASQAETITISDSSISASTALYPARWNGTDARWNEFQWWDNKTFASPLYGIARSSDFTTIDAFQHACTVTGVTGGTSGWTFNGTSDVVDGGNAAILALAKFTATFVFRADAVTTESDIFTKVVSPDYVKGYIEGGTLRCQLTVTGPAYPVLAGTSTITAGTWYHGTVRYDQATLDVFVNGALDGSTAETRAMAANATTILRLGGNASYFNGIISDFILYNRALSVAEVAAAYTEAKSRMSWLP